MNEASIRGEIYKMLRINGYWPTRGRDAIICPRCHMKLLPPIGRPDLLVLAPKAMNRVIEVKDIDYKVSKSLAFNEITREQRQWLNNWSLYGGVGYLAIGTINVKPRRMWIIEWMYWITIERDAQHLTGRESIAVDLEEGQYPAIVKASEYDLNRVAKPWECKWVNGGWEVPADHSLRSGFSDRIPEWHTVTQDTPKE